MHSGINVNKADLVIKFLMQSGKLFFTKYKVQQVKYNVTLVNIIVYIDGEKRVMKYHNDKSIDEADGEQDGMPSGDENNILEDIENVKKVSPLRIYFSLLKGFVCTGILYMPKNFQIGGWLWGIACMFLSFLLTQLCAQKLLQARARHPGASFTDLGRLSMGKPGQFAVDIFLTVAQVGFLIGQTYFIASNLQSVMHEGFDIYIDIRLYCLFCFVITTPLSYVRKIEKFAFSYVIADMLIFVTTVVILFFATYHVTENGWGEGVVAFNTSTWLTMIGSAVYAYEGFGTILPLLDVAERPELFEKTLFLVLATVFVFYTSFGVYCYFIYGQDLVDPLITANLQPQGLLVYSIKVAFSMNLVLTFPLTVYPANIPKINEAQNFLKVENQELKWNIKFIIIIESYIFGSMKASKTRTMLKNLSRTIVSLIGVGVCVLVGKSVNKFISLSEFTMACTPISFLLPTLFHLKLAGPLTQKEKIIDYCIVALSIQNICDFLLSIDKKKSHNLKY